MKRLLLNIWQLPQNILAEIVLAFCHINFIAEYNDVKVYGVKRIRCGVSLGNHIIIRNYGEPYLPPVKCAHEYGHSIQSRRLGWFYLPSAGLLSGTRNLLKLYRKGHYFDKWPENQADKLGGVKRTGSGIRYV